MISAQTRSLLLLACLLLAAVGPGVVEAQQRCRYPTRWAPLYNLFTPEIQRLGRFAVSQYNKQAWGRSYLYLAVLGAERAGTCGGASYYRLVIQVKEGFYVVRVLRAVVYKNYAGTYLKLSSGAIFPY